MDPCSLIDIHMLNIRCQLCNLELIRLYFLLLSASTYYIYSCPIVIYLYREAKHSQLHRRDLRC